MYQHHILEDHNLNITDVFLNTLQANLLIFHTTFSEIVRKYWRDLCEFVSGLYNDALTIAKGVQCQMIGLCMMNLNKCGSGHRLF
jgi:hypothetical protein